jgi:hypothetical protein
VLLLRDRVQFCSGLVDLVECVRRHGSGRHRLTFPGERFVGYDESHLAAVLCHFEAEHGDPQAALEYFALAIRNHHDSGNITMIRTLLAVLISFLEVLGIASAGAT